jgi:4-amino-4-deoxy-L-arabinose transferase-like glycosyltransferase
LNTFFRGLSNFSTRAVYIIYGIFAAILIFDFVTDSNKKNYVLLLVGFVFMCTVGTYILNKASLYLDKFNAKKSFILLLIICFVVKLIWVLLYRIEPLVDYATFYYTAVSLSENFVINNRYVALFPHIFGYSGFLSIFLDIFGSNYMIPPILNVFLSTISMALIYFICKKLGGSRAAIIASILWIVFPSQTIFNMFALSEPLYCTVLLMIWAFMIVIHERLPNISIKRLILYSVLLALLLVLMNMARPIAAIPIIALAIWLFIIETGHIGNKRIFFKKALYLVSVIISYSVLSSATNHYIAERVGEEIATTPGYNIHVGFNMESTGRWNQEDSNLLYYYNDQKGLSANDVQEKMFEEAKNRLQSGEVNFLELVYDKFLIFLGDDSAAVGYASSVLDHTDKVRYTVISNIFYYFLIAVSFVGVLIGTKSKNKSPVFFICLYFIGLTLAQLLVEVAGRYHYSATISMIILASLGISGIFKDLKLK